MFALNYTDIQLFNPEAFEAELNSGKQELQVFREALQQGHKILKVRFEKTHNAIQYILQRAWLVDQILIRALQHFCIWPPAYQKHLALVAVGGYGRGELHPASDIDLMILLDKPADDYLQDCIQRFIMFLWDIRLEVGHSVRTVEECQQEAANDISVATNLMEARLLVGPEDLFKNMQKYVGPQEIWSNKDFFAEKIKEQDRRHVKFHDTAYNLEPNVKEGPGGLRDIHVIGWVAKRYFGANTLNDLVKHNFLTDREYQQLSEGQAFLGKIRCALHFHAKRKEDRLLFDYQRILAKEFGYQDTDNRLGVEHFMKAYYRTIMELNTLNDLLLQLFKEAILYANNRLKVKPLNKRFQICNHYIEVINDKVFMHYPFALLEIFLFMQQYQEIQGIRAHTIRLIRQHVYLIDQAFHQDLRARSLFFEIIRQPQGISRALHYMSRYGVLGAYIPAFGRIVGQMQYDLFHVYTVDQHTLFVVRNLRRFSISKYQHEFPLCSKIVAQLPKLELLYLAGLFHDIAKGRGGDHSILGENEALNFCHEHGLSDYDARFVGWLVKNHLLMSVTAQRQDISDPDVINNFAKKVQDLVHLDYLYVLTVADIRATNPNLWNGWKDTLLTNLYHKTQHVLRHGLTKVFDKDFQVQDTQTQARYFLLAKGIDDNRINTLWQQLGEDYFLRSSAKDVARETNIILESQNKNQALVLERQGSEGITEFLFYVTDRDYLFAETTNYLEQQGLTIVDAYIIPTDSEHTIGGYAVLESEGDPITDNKRVNIIMKGLEEVLNHEVDRPFCPINRRISRQLKHFPVPTRITFSQDMHNDHTVMEVITTDRPGVLSCIAQAFMHCEVRLKKAKIATFGSRVEDIFFITDKNNHALYSPDQLDCLNEHLSHSLEQWGN